MAVDTINVSNYSIHVFCANVSGSHSAGEKGDVFQVVQRPPPPLCRLGYVGRQSSVYSDKASLRLKLSPCTYLSDISIHVFVTFPKLILYHSLCRLFLISLSSFYQIF